MNDDRTRSDYPRDQADAARALCAAVARRLDRVAANLVVVGGIVPTLLVPAPHPALGIDPHLGTNDVDLGLALRLASEGRHRVVVEQLRAGGFEPATNEKGNVTLQQWRLPGVAGVRLDLLVAHVPGSPRPQSNVRQLGADLAAYVVPGLELAFDDPIVVALDGARGDVGPATVRVCEPGAYLVLKALALNGRRRAKDAYDLDWLLQAFPGGVDEIARRLRLVRDGDAKSLALEVLDREYSRPEADGPDLAARFLDRAGDDAIRADAFGRMRRLLALAQGE